MKWLNWRFAGILALLVLSGAGIARQYRDVGPDVRSVPSEEYVVLQGVKVLEVLPTRLPRDLDFGKGKFGLFEVSLPAGEDFRLERMVIEKDGATDAEMPEVWLRINGVRVYAAASFDQGVATIVQFPPASEQPPAAGASLVGIPYETLSNEQETQFLLKPGGDLPRTFSAGGDFSVGVYGKWTPAITSREPRDGIRFCLKEISGTMLPSGKPAKTNFAQSLCWPHMGIQ